MARTPPEDLRYRRGSTPPVAPPITPPPSSVTPPAPASTPAPNPIIPVVNQNALERSYAQALYPFLSISDKSTLSSTYGFELPTERTRPGMGNAPVGGLNRNTVLGRDRAALARSALESARAAGGGSATDPGFAFLNQTIELLNKYGALSGEEGMSRDAYSRFSTDLTSLMEQAKALNVPAFYQQMASMFLNPTYSQGALMEQSKVGGRVMYGAPSKRLFT